LKYLFSYHREGRFMFNKPNVFGRSEPIARRDATPILGSGSKSAALATDASASKNATVTTVAKEAAGNTVAASTPPIQTATSGNASSHVTVESSKESSSNEAVLGARLIVGPDVKLKGAEILDCDTLVVEGRVEATMDSRVIRIAENGSFSGKVSIDIAEIHGTFEGELTARSQLIIHSTGRVSGTIRYGKLVADEGGELCGDINVISETIPSKAKPVIEPFVTLTAAVG
jgi:cytoskeletal protein CcmA (bactofilin family)